ncbi:MAG: 4-(cytidine 5'-diphospho)-2-C-methyl-D-erythritol kinase [Prolixibacteraceae bacterium]
MIIFPNAKINIGLNVVSKRTDGYHNLETVFYPVPLSDALEVVDTRRTKFTFSGIHIDGAIENNLIYKAWKLLAEDFEIPPVHFHLHKTIPFGAGLGGGSSDAAFTLKLLNDYCGLELNVTQLKKYASRIGADCSFFIQNKPVLAKGIGDQFSPLEIDLSPYRIIIVKPGISVSTPEAYRKVIPAKSAFDLAKLPELPVEEWKNAVENDFEKSVFLQYPQIKKLKNSLYEAGAIYASMSGSGSALYGIFRHSPVNIDKFIPDGLFVYR